MQACEEFLFAWPLILVLLKGQYRERSSTFLDKLCWKYKGALTDEQDNF